MPPSIREGSKRRSPGQRLPCHVARRPEEISARDPLRAKLPSHEASGILPSDPRSQKARAWDLSLQCLTTSSIFCDVDQPSILTEEPKPIHPPVRGRPVSAMCAPSAPNHNPPVSLKPRPSVRPRFAQPGNCHEATSETSLRGRTNKVIQPKIATCSLDQTSREHFGVQHDPGLLSAES